MNDRDALFAAILAHPDEDTPRLAYADYLDEHGGEADREYAAFIRKQIELSRVPGWEVKEVRAWKPEDSSAAGGYGFDARRPPLPASGLGWHVLDTFRRGFPWHVRTDKPHPFLGAADRLFRAAPIQALTVEGDRDGYDRMQLTDLLASPHLARLRKLVFSLCRFAPHTTRTLCECPHLANLRSLALEYVTLDPGAARKLLPPALLERLESLELMSSILPWSETAAAFDAAGGPHRLRRFALMPFNQMRLTHAEVFQKPLFRGLRELEIFRCNMNELQARALLDSPAFDTLESLHLSSGVPGIWALASSAALRGLKALKLGDNRLGPVAVKALAASPHLSGLRVFSLHNNPLGDKGAIELARAPWLRSLEHLELASCDIGDAGAEAVAAALDPNALVRLTLWSNRCSGISDRVRQKLKDAFGDRVAV